MQCAILGKYERDYDDANPFVRWEVRLVPSNSDMLLAWSVTLSFAAVLAKAAFFVEQNESHCFFVGQWVLWYLNVMDFAGENCVMATREQQTAAKKKMAAAEAALENYVNRSPDVDADLALHRRLAEELRVAMHEFLETLK